MLLRFLIPLLTCLVVLPGCAEGPFWRSGKLTPWARNQWEEEARIADTLFAKKQKLNDKVNVALNGTLNQQESVAQELAEVIRRDPILLLRLHAVELVGQLNCPAATECLKEASKDYNSDLRIAAIRAWQNKPVQVAVPALQEILGSDTNVDVRLAATRAIGAFSGHRAVSALSIALQDRDPALQLRAAESLEQVTGEPLGQDIVAWQEYLKKHNAIHAGNLPNASNPASVAERPKRYDLR